MGAVDNDVGRLLYCRAMPGSNALPAALALLGLGAGYGVAFWQYHRIDPPPRVVTGAKVPEGTASDLQQALLHQDSFERVALVSQILSPLGPEALPAVRSAYESVILDLGDIELVQLVDWWGRFDPQAAFTWARESGIGWHPAVLQAAARAWARIDPETAARALTEQVQDPRLVNAAMVGLVRGWEESGHPGLGEYLSDPGKDEEHFGFAIDAVVRAKIYRGGPQAAMAWAEGLPDNEDGTPTPYKQRAFKRLATVLVDLDPQAAGNFVASHRTRSFGIALLLRVGTSWAKGDGAAAMRWLQSLPPGDDLPTVVQETYRMWFTTDMPAASAWLREQPLDPWLDPAISTFASWQTQEDPQEAVAWAGRVHDPYRRKLAYGKVLLTWLRDDPEAAQAWLDGAGADLPEETRAHIAKLRELRIPKPPQPTLENMPGLPAPHPGWLSAPPGETPPPQPQG